MTGMIYEINRNTNKTLVKKKKTFDKAHACKRFTSGWHFTLDKSKASRFLLHRHVIQYFWIHKTLQYKKTKRWTETININNTDNSNINSKGTGNNIIPTFPRLAGLYSPANQNQQSSQYRCKSAETEDRSSVLPVWHLHIGPAVDWGQTASWGPKCSGH